jgi:hypothetical protein
MKWKYGLLLVLMTLATVRVSAQDDVEYRMEVGAAVGLMGYHGDFNGSLTKDLQPMGSLVVRYIFNPYMGLKANVSYGMLKGSSADVKTWYPEYSKTPYSFSNFADVNTWYPEFSETPYSFSNKLVDLDVVYEYNFWPYGTGRDYRGAKRLTPYLLLGLGGTFVKTDQKNVFTANLPIGVGVKYKVGARVNVGLEWAMHFSLNDELDGVKDPYGIKSSGLFKNTDCYSTLQLSVTYSFMAKCRTCHNEDE